MKTTFLEPLQRRHGRDRLQLVNERTGAVVATQLTVAFSSADRRRGLLGRDGLDPGEALIIAPCFAVHTAFMRFAIDIVFTDRDGRVSGVRSRIQPWRLSAAWTAFATIELAAGAAGHGDVRRGDRLLIRPAADHLMPASASRRTASGQITRLPQP